jgi:hypothetical protein
MTGRTGNILRWVPALFSALLICCLASLALAASMRPALDFKSPRAPAAWAVGSSTFADLSVKANELIDSHRTRVRGVDFDTPPFETPPSTLLEHSAVEASALAFQSDAEQASSQPLHRASEGLMPSACAAASAGSASVLRLFPTGPPASVGIPLHA